MNKPNIHPVTGIAYGVINANNLDGDVLHTISFENGIDMDYVDTQADWAKPLGFVAPVADPGESTYQYYKRVQDELNQFDAEWHTFEQENEDFTGTSFCANYEGVDTLYSTEGNTVMVTYSPHVNKVQQCSPCFPNAGDLDNPDENGIMAYMVPLTWLYNEYN